MLKHEVGIKKIPQALYEVDDSYFAGPVAEPTTGPNGQAIDLKLK